ncbi:MAG: NADH:flavin oxidoreductase/NADH oxidase family protein [Polyangiaceae bacterium]|nr:NADH:flavin oxidoreductase/NADH oxidase family protein [Polyangiaceae bacterium]
MSVLGTPFRLPCGLTLANRLVKSAMAEGLATAHQQPTPRHAALYEAWARGGAGLLVTGNVMVDPRYIGARGDVAMHADFLGAFRAWALAATRHGVPILLQLNHPGRQTPRTLTPQPVAPSAVSMTRMAGAFAPPRALAPQEVETIVRQFAEAASLAERAGFNGVEIHAAHGYLLSQFLSPVSNVRRDAWGGDLGSRARLLLEVVRAVRRATHRDFAVAVKLNASDLQRGGFDVASCVTVARWLEAEGVDLLELSGGTYESDGLLGGARRGPDAYFAEYARTLRPEVRVPLLLTGGQRNAVRMAGLLQAGTHDLVGIARPLAVVPDFPARILRGEQPTLPGPARFPVRALASIAELSWYTEQIQRIARGEEASPTYGPLRALLRAARELAG